jgi:hypothetical protein
MAVPSSGALNMLNLAREALYGTWGSGTITSPISLYDLVNGGNTNGSGNSYPTVNTGCTPNPATRGSLSLTDVEDNMGVDPPTTYYYSAGIGDASNLVAGHIIYTDSALTTPAQLACAIQAGSSATTTICGAGGNSGCISTNNSGALISTPTC